MADEPTQAGNDQQDAPQEEQTPAGDDQQNKQTPAEAERIAQLEEELKNTNAYITRMQQQGAQPDETAQPQPDTEPDDGSEEYSQYGLTKEQVKALRKVTGADELQAKLSEYEKREQEREKQEGLNSWKSDMNSLAKEFKDSGIDPTTPAEQEKLLRFMDENNYPPHLAKVAFKELHGARLETTKKEDTPAAKSDRSDAPEPADDASYKAALKKASTSNGKVDLEKLAEVEAQFKGNPTV